MKKTKYVYDPLSLAYRKVEKNWKDRLRDTGVFILASILLGILFFFGLQVILDSPEEKILKRELAETEMLFEQLDRRVASLSGIIQQVERRDDEVYRVIFESDPPSRENRLRGISGSAQRYATIRGLPNGELLERSALKVDQLSQRVNVQSKSLDELADLVTKKEALLSALPAIRPLKDQPGTWFSSSYGYRFHPILKKNRMHTGVDFSAPRMTPIYATADGIVISNERFGGKGFGKHITISHGFGYHTLYAHMHKTAAPRGRRVKRGELIGYVGRTGRSTANHLHYEVIYNGRRVNPINYFFNDLSPEEYNDLLIMAESANQSMD
jgi:murein DD-endopeptidase MepM/ murein hydrolase activator NlpD